MKNNFTSAAARTIKTIFWNRATKPVTAVYLAGNVICGAVAVGNGGGISYESPLHFLYGAYQGNVCLYKKAFKDESLMECLF